MQFIQIRDGVAIRKSDILAVEKLAEGGSRLTTSTAVYDTNFLYDSVLVLLEEREKIERKPMGQGSWGQQYWRG